LITGVIEVDKYWERLEPLILKSITNRRFTETETLDSIKLSLIKRERQLWYCHDEKGEAIIITTIRILPKTKILYVSYVGGKNIDGFFLESYETLKAFAKDKGCSQLRLAGRKGWARKIPDNSRELITLEIDL